MFLGGESLPLAPATSRSTNAFVELCRVFRYPFCGVGAASPQKRLSPGPRNVGMRPGLPWLPAPECGIFPYNTVSPAKNLAVAPCGQRRGTVFLWRILSLHPCPCIFRVRPAAFPNGFCCFLNFHLYVSHVFSTESFFHRLSPRAFHVKQCWAKNNSLYWKNLEFYKFLTPSRLPFPRSFPQVFISAEGLLPCFFTPKTGI